MAAIKRKLLVVDLGNSETVVGVFGGETLLAQWRLGSRARTMDEVSILLASLFANSELTPRGMDSVLSSVVPPATARFAEALTAATGRAPVVVGERRIPRLSIRFSEPASIGPDRLANTLAVQEFHGKPAIVVDLGTATTFDVIGPRGEYIGGAIAPGVLTSSEDLFRRAARLGRVELVIPRHAIGDTTEESLQSGIVLGAAGMVDALVRRIESELGRKARVVATGGLAGLITPASETIEVVDEWLTLHGLRLIHERMATVTVAKQRPKRR